MNVKQAANVLDLIEFFAQRLQPASLSEISRHFGWPRSSAFNLLRTLASRGFLYEQKSRGGYYPTPLWSSLLRRIDGADPIPHQFHELLESLVEATGETAVLAAASGASALFVDAVESPHAVRYTAKPGKLIPLHVTATGRALLSQMDATERAILLRRATFERFTSTTLMSPAAVEREIRKSTERGWFQGNGEFTQDLGGVAVPIEIERRQLAILVAGPMSRVKGRHEKLAATVSKLLARHLRSGIRNNPG